MTSLKALARDIHMANVAKGFWDQPRPLTETTMLIVTELAEAIEAEREGGGILYYLDLESDDEYGAHQVWVEPTSGFVYIDGLDETDDWIPLKPEGIDVELIDALIRLLDLLGSRGVDVSELLRQKLAYNARRAPKHGKAY